MATNAATTTFLGIENWIWVSVVIIIVVIGAGMLVYFKKRNTKLDSCFCPAEFRYPSLKPRKKPTAKLPMNGISAINPTSHEAA